MGKKDKHLTPEEKKAFKEAKKEAKARAAEVLKIQTRNAELEREIKYGTEAVKLHEQRWRNMLKGVALPQIRNDLEYTWHAFECVLDSKDFTISLLLDELKQADEQYYIKIRSQIDNIDRLITIYFDQVNDLWYESKKAIMGLFEAATIERNEVHAIATDHEDYMKTMLYGQSFRDKESNKTFRGAYLASIEMENNKLKDVTTRHIQDLTLMWDNMWKAAQKFQSHYSTEFDQKKTNYTELEALDGEANNKIKESWVKIGKKYNEIKMFKAEIRDLEGEDVKLIEELANKRRYYDKEALELKKKVREEKAVDNNNLTLLAMYSNDVIAWLKENETKGTRLLTMSAVCRKLETAPEKTMAFPTYYMDFMGVEESSYKIDPEEDATELSVAQLSKYLKLFWNRIGMVEVSRYKLQQQCEAVQTENELLRKKLFAYCECLNCEPQMELLYSNEALKK